MSNKGKILPYLAAIISSMIFGLSFLFTKRALSVATPISIVAFRFLIAFLVMSVLIIFKIIKVNYKNKPLGLIALLSLFEPVIYFIFETYGLQRTASSLGGLMISLIPIAVTILGIYFLQEKPTMKQTIFIIASVIGVAIIGMMNSSGDTGSSLFGMLLMIGAVMSAAFFSIISRKISKQFNAFEITYFMMISGAVSFNGLSIIMHLVNKDISSYFKPLTSFTFLTSVIYLGIVSSIIAYFLLNYSLAKLQASKATVFSNISTIVSILAGVIFLNESFRIYHLVGSALILIGVWGTSRFSK
ncbi:DMT family transporter [Candidatus Clostridium stratigraminis]|uniref:DMT family transporter n=1 Tax=Candidatus Clostridium stratigraminis TaxID=3381661 RepID=A0ABW8T6W8_9CLOT